MPREHDRRFGPARKPDENGRVLPFFEDRDLEAGLLVLEACELPVFSDGFESGDTSAWSATVP